MENNPVTGITHSLKEAKITIVDVEDKPGIAAAIFGCLAKACVNVGVIVQTSSANGKTTDITTTIPRDDMERAVEMLKAEKETIGFKEILHDKHVAKLSLVGLGMRSRPGIAATMFGTLAEKGINIQIIETSEINISVLIAEEYVELAIRALHTAFDLDTKDGEEEAKIEG